MYPVVLTVQTTRNPQRTCCTPFLKTPGENHDAMNNTLNENRDPVLYKKWNTRILVKQCTRCE